MIWYGFDGVGNETRLIDEQVHADPTLGNLYRLEQRRRPGKPIRTLHAGRLRISTTAQAAQSRGWPDVAAMFSIRTKTGLISGAPAERC